MTSPGVLLLIACLVAVGVGLGGVVLGATLSRRRLGRADAGSARAVPAPPAPSADATPDLERRRAAIDERTRTLDRAERMRNLLLSKMSHDLRTPLNSVITLSQLLYDGNTGPLTIEQKKYIEVIHRSGRTLLELVTDVLDLVALETGRLELDVAPVELPALVREVAASGAEIARRKGLPLRSEIDWTDTLVVSADQERLRQILINLIEDAVNDRASGHVEIGADRAGGMARLRVTGTGATGATGDDTRGEPRPESLDAFLSAPAGSGTSAGLRLILAERLIRLMGGELAFDAAAGRGAAFAVTLPLAPEAAARPERQDGAGVAAGPPAELPRAGGHVLLVDDDDIERRHVATLLENAGYEVSLATSGDEGLERMRRERFDAVVLDLVMPGKSGLDVLRAARADERLAPVPFVVLSALYMTKSERDVLGPRVVGVVRKGGGIGEELVTHLRRAIATATPPRPAVAPNGPTARVLVVEDDEDNLFTLRQILSSLPVTVEAASSGHEAVEICRGHRPDLVVMDVDLPGMSGLEATRDIRRIPGCADVPVIALTADATGGERGPGRDGGRDGARLTDYLTKPAQPREIVSAVSRALHIGAAEQQGAPPSPPPGDR